MFFKVIIAVAIACACAYAQSDNNKDIARLLSNEETRERTVATIQAEGAEKIPLLLSWTRNPPVEVEKSGLRIGLADAFGRLHAKEAIPFLIQNISLQRWLPSPNIWMKTPKVIEERLPAAAALIRIGPEASKALIAGWEGFGTEDRSAAVFVVSRIKGVPEARGFLSSVLGQATMERHLAEEGIKALDGNH
jgi:HEAT repeat protein